MAVLSGPLKALVICWRAAAPRISCARSLGNMLLISKSGFSWATAAPAYHEQCMESPRACNQCQSNTPSTSPACCCGTPYAKEHQRTSRVNENTPSSASISLAARKGLGSPHTLVASSTLKLGSWLRLLRILPTWL